MNKMGKQKKTICPSIPHCAGSQISDVYDTICGVEGACGNCYSFVTRNPIKEGTISAENYDPKKILVGNNYKWDFSDPGIAA